jgi:hypothetical protein
MGREDRECETKALMRAGGGGGIEVCGKFPKEYLLKREERDLASNL